MIIMEYIEGKLIGQLSDDEVDIAVAEAKKTIEKLHALGLVHGDARRNNLIWKVCLFILNYK